MILPCHSFVMAEHRGRLLPVTLLSIVQRDEAGEAAPAAALQGRIHVCQCVHMAAFCPSSQAALNGSSFCAVIVSEETVASCL